MSRPKRVLVAFMNAILLGEWCTQMKCTTYLPVEKPKVGELQMDWLRSEDLKEEKSVTASVVIIAVDHTLSFGVLAEHYDHTPRSQKQPRKFRTRAE
jgi:hypothetical protein